VGWPSTVVGMAAGSLPLVRLSRHASYALRTSAPWECCVLLFDLCLQESGGVLVVKDKGALVPVVEARVFRAATPTRPTSAHRGLLALKA
jgi:hypothetical protein